MTWTEPKMKIHNLVVTMMLAGATAFASGDEVADKRASFDRSVRLLRNIFSQTASQTGADGTRVTCTILPQEDMTALALKIEYPSGSASDVGLDDIGLSGTGGAYEMIDTREALDRYFRWADGQNASNETRESFAEAHNMPGEDMEESAFYASDFPFNDPDTGAVCGLVYFACRMKDAASVTASVRSGEETYKLAFDGDGP